MCAVVVNSGCANACTGERGLRDARATARQAATLLGIRPTQVVVASTGVIGVYLPMDRLSKGLERAVKVLSHGPEACFDAAEAIMTTDHVPKMAAYAWHEGDRRYVVGGIAKGSGMISPSMATMLAFVVTDAPDFSRRLARSAARSERRQLQHDLRRRRHVHQRLVYAFAKPGTERATPGFRAALAALCRDLAVAMVRDGEGATKTLVFNVTGAKDEAQARTIAPRRHQQLAREDRALRRRSELGPRDRGGRRGARRTRCGEVVAQTRRSVVGRASARSKRSAKPKRTCCSRRQTIEITLDLGIGDATATGWGCDFSTDYVRINAHYRT